MSAAVFCTCYRQRPLTAVGGFRGLSPTGALQSLTTSDDSNDHVQSWAEILPPMPTKRGRVAALCTGKHLIVAAGRLAVVGGRLGPGVTIRTLMEESGYVRKVEMLDTESEQWYTLASLPQASTELSISLCSRNLYLLGGWSSKDRTKTMITYHLQSLLRTATIALSSTTTVSTPSSVNVWQRAADVPVFASSSTVLSWSLLGDLMIMKLQQIKCMPMNHQMIHGMSLAIFLKHVIKL